MHNFLLAHDLGTSGDKAVLFDTMTMEIVAHRVQPYDTIYLQNGGVEQDSDSWWNAVCVSTRELLKMTGIEARQIQAVSFSAIMNSCLPVDHTCRPLRNAMIWCDQRAVEAVDQIRSCVSESVFTDMTGHKLNRTYALSKMLWFKKNEPELYRKTAHFVQAKDYVVYKLTGEIATDYTDSSHLGVMDQGNKCYWTELLKDVGIAEELLPEMHVSTEVVGRVTSEAASESGLLEGTPIVIGGGDGCCANAGAGLYKPGRAYNIMGTSSWHGTLSEHMLKSANHETASFIHLDGRHFAALGTMQSAGHSLNWLLEFLNAETFNVQKDAIFSQINEVLKEKIYNKNLRKLIYLPYLLGERSPWWNSNARGCFIGLDASTGPEDAVLACMEGVGFNLKIILDAMEEKLGALSMRIIGGGARNVQWVELLASIWNKQLEIPKYITEATSLGAIMCAGIGINMFNDFSIVDRINPTVACVKANPYLRERAEQMYPVFKRAYLSLVNVFDDLYNM